MNPMPYGPEQAALAKKKYDFIQRCKRFELEFQRFQEKYRVASHIKVDELKASQRVVLYDILVLNDRIKDYRGRGLGPDGDKLLRQIVSKGMGDRIVTDLKRYLNLLGSFSRRLKLMGRDLYGMEIEDFNLYVPVAKPLEEVVFGAESVDMVESWRAASAPKGGDDVESED
jgi:hypothetical protein